MNGKSCNNCKKKSVCFIYKQCNGEHLPLTLARSCKYWEKLGGDKKMFRIKAYIPLEVEGIYETREEAEREIKNLEEMQPCNKYEVEEIDN